MSKKLLATAAIALMILVLTLGFQNRELRERYRQADDRVSLPYVGMFVPEIAAMSSDEHIVHLGKPSGMVQVIYFFNTTCPHCVSSVPAIKKLSALLLNHSQVEFVAVSQDSRVQTAAYFTKQGMNLAFVSLPESRTLALFHAQAVPVLIIIDPTGKVRFSIVGRLAATDDVDSTLAAVHNLEG